MIITPNVQTYVKSYFNCQSAVLGALIEEEGGSGSGGSHWERKVYFDEYMTASVWSAGGKVTLLTLNFFKDTGFYYEVDMTKAENPYFGKNQGCTFAEGGASAAPEYCDATDTSTVCGFDHTYGGYCSTGDRFGSGAAYIRPYSNILCAFPENIDGTNSWGASIYNSQSRCLKVGANPLCLPVTCSGNNMQFTIGGANHDCTEGSTVSTSSGTVTCPANYEVFCARQNC